MTMLFSNRLAVFEEFVVVVGHSVGLLITGFLIEQLGFEEVGHLRGTCLIEVTIQSQVLFCLFDAAFGDGELLAGFFDVVPSFLHADAEKFGLISELLLSLLVLQLLTLDGVGASPPSTDGHADGGEYHRETVVVVEQVVIVIACTHANGWQVLAHLHLMLQGGGAHLLLQELILGES